MISLVEAVKSNNSRILQLLVAVPRAVKQNELETAFIHAAKLGHNECIDILLATGIHPDTTDTNNNTALMYAAQMNHDVTLQTLVSAKASVNWVGSGKSTPLHMVAKHGYEKTITLLLEHGAKLNTRDSAGNTPLIIAVMYGQYTTIKALIAKGCDVNIINSKGWSALHYASHKARGVNILLAAGANPNCMDKDGITPLLMAASEGYDNVVKALVQAKCDVNIANHSVKKTALHILAYKGHPGSIEDLILGGADINLVDSENHTPLWYAIKNSKLEVIRLLLRANSQADTYQCPENIPSEACPVRLAIQQKMINVLKLLILTGYDRHHLRACFFSQEDSDWLKNVEEFSHWLDHASGALTLKQTCRMWIRHQLGRTLYHDLQQLPLPQAMKDYLLMKELDDH
ncbi:hypothetical protein CHS0354_010212 [Potamilus streckersoni]|uniref:SOCS box domain-containing protein n=1 Tax=Potamilus streckersoni TaxID=2493646 RepID=A0AAE0RST1_9BIVA|nr:hypothetical protein CHS0354_010212 [Potamilus streckersoni]